jgi:hypothetical protein
MIFSDELIRYVLAGHWNRRPAVSIAASVRARFDANAQTEHIKYVIGKYTLRHHGEVVERRDWPCDQKPI